MMADLKQAINMLEVGNLTRELGSVIGSDLFEHDDYIKSYLQDPEVPLITKVKIGLRYYVTADLILQLAILKDYLGIESYLSQTLSSGAKST